MNSEPQNPEPQNSEPQNPNAQNLEGQSPESQNQQGGHDVPLTPPPANSAAPTPPASYASPAPAAPKSSSGSGARAGAIAIAAFGGIALLGAGGTAAFASVYDIRASASSGAADLQSVTVEGVDGLDVDVSASDVTVRFGDVEEATLEVSGDGDHKWRLARSDGELVVRNDQNPFGWLDGGWFGGWFDYDETVVLTLPESLNDARLDADFSISAGNLDIEGAFGEVDIDMGAGGLSMEGSASSVEADVNAGRAQLELSGVTEADFSVSAGKLEATLADTAPSLVTIDVSAGSLELTVPDDVYDVSQDVSAGSLDNRLDTSSSSRHKIDASVSAGSVVLRAED